MTTYTGDGDRKAMFMALAKGERVQLTSGLADELLEELPPRFMYRTVRLIGGEAMYAAFGVGLGEGETPTVAVWKTRERGQSTYFAEQVSREGVAFNTPIPVRA